MPILARFAAVLLAALALPAAAQPPPLEPGPTPTRAAPLERCADFCANFFAAGSRERTECVAGCADADACSKLCDERFPDDPGKHTACFKRCMRSKAT